MTLDLALQIGPCRLEPVGKLLRVTGGTDQPAVIEAIEHAGGVRDGGRKFWWIEARNLPAFAEELRGLVDPLFRSDLPGV
jgi:hypothetical protein